MKASQYIYTSWRNGNSTDKGFMIYSKSTDITEIECSEIFFAMQYVVPRDLNLVPTEQEIVDTFPYSFASFTLSSGRHCVAQSTYLGRDYTGRFGNYLVYALVFEQEELETYPVEFFGQEYMKTYMTEEELNASSPVPPLPQLEISDYGQIINSDELYNFVSEREEEFAYFLSAVLYAKKKKVPLYINDTRENLVLWFAALQEAFPLSIAKKINFTTYVGNHTKFNDMNAKVKFDCYGVRSGEFSIDYKSAVTDYDKVAVDFLGGHATENIPILNVAKALAESYTLGMDEIYSFSDFLQEYNVTEFDGNLEAAYIAYSLINNDEFEFNEENLKQLLEFAKVNESSSFSETLASKLISAYSCDYKLNIDITLELVDFLYKYADYMMYSVHGILLHVIEEQITSQEDYDKIKAYIQNMKDNACAVYSDFTKYISSGEITQELSAYFQSCTNRSEILLVYRVFLELLLYDKRSISDQDLLLKTTIASLPSINNSESLLIDIIKSKAIGFDVMIDVISIYLSKATETQKTKLTSLLGSALVGYSENDLQGLLHKAFSAQDFSFGLGIAEAIIRNAEDCEKKFWLIYKTQIAEKLDCDSLDISGLVLAYLENNPSYERACRILDKIRYSQIKDERTVRMLASCFESLPLKKLRSEGYDITRKMVELSKLRNQESCLKKVIAIAFLHTLTIPHADFESYFNEFKVDVDALDKKDYSEFIEEALPMLLYKATTTENIAKIFSELFSTKYCGEFCDSMVDYFKKLIKEYKGKWLDINTIIFAYAVDNERDTQVEAFFEEYRGYFYKLEDEDQNKIMSEAKRKSFNIDSKFFKLATQKEGFASKLKRFFKH